MERKIQVEFPLDDDVVIECSNCHWPLKIKRGTEVDRYWHCDPRPGHISEDIRPTEEQVAEYMKKLLTV